MNVNDTCKLQCLERRREGGWREGAVQAQLGIALADVRPHFNYKSASPMPKPGLCLPTSLLVHSTSYVNPAVSNSR